MKAPERMLLVDDDGNPLSMIDTDQLQADATRLMYAYAAASGDDAELDRIAREWITRNDPRYFGYLAAAALSLITRNVLEPSLQVLDEALPHIKFREFLADARDNTERDLGGTN